MKRTAGPLFLWVYFFMIPDSAWSDTMAGTVLLIDRDANILIVNTPDGERRLEITEQTRGVEHIKEGNEVTVEYSVDETGTRLKADKVVLRSNPIIG